MNTSITLAPVSSVKHASRSLITSTSRRSSNSSRRRRRSGNTNGRLFVMGACVIVSTSLRLQSVALVLLSTMLPTLSESRNSRPAELRQRQHLTPAAAAVSGRAASGVEVAAAPPARGIRRMFNSTRSALGTKNYIECSTEKASPTVRGNRNDKREHCCDYCWLCTYRRAHFVNVWNLDIS